MCSLLSLQVIPDWTLTNKITSLEFHRPKKFQSLAMLKLEVTHLFEILNMKNVSRLSNELGKKSFIHYTFLLEILYWK